MPEQYLPIYRNLSDIGIVSGGEAMFGRAGSMDMVVTGRPIIGVIEGIDEGGKGGVVGADGSGRRGI